MWFSEGLTFCFSTTRVPQILPLILCLSYLTDNHILLFGAGCVSDTMTKARFDCIGHLVTKGAFSSGKVDLSKSMTLFFFFLNFTTLSTCSSVIQFKDISMILWRLRTGILLWKESPTPSSGSKVSPGSSRVMMVLYVLKSPLGSSSPWGNLGITWSYKSHLCSFGQCLHMFEVWKKYNNFFQIIYNVFRTPNHIALRAKVTHDDKVGTVEGFMTSIYDIIVTLKTWIGRSWEM